MTRNVGFQDEAETPKKDALPRAFLTYAMAEMPFVFLLMGALLWIFDSLPFDLGLPVVVDADQALYAAAAVGCFALVNMVLFALILMPAMRKARHAGR